MNTKLSIGSEMSALIERARKLETLEELEGRFVLEQWRDGELISTLEFPNGATDAGKQYLLGAAFAGVTPATVWYFGIINGTGSTPALLNSDVAGSHTGWTEFVLYDETVRQTWVKAINTGTNSMNSSAPAAITISTGLPTSPFIAGAFLISDNTKGGATGTLYATGLYPVPVPIQTTDVFKMNYTTGL